VNLEQGIAQVDAKNYRKGLQLYIQALEAVAPYINEQLKTDYKGQEVYWGATLLDHVSSVVQGFQLAPTAGIFQLYWGQQVAPNLLGFQLTRDNKPVQNIPIYFTYSEDFIRPRVVMTDGVGLAYAQLGKLRKTKANQFIGAHVDLESIYQEMEGDKEAFISEVLVGMQAPDIRMNLDVQSPKVYLSITASELGKKSNGKSYREVLEEVLVKYEYQVVSKKSQADLVMELEAKTVIAGTRNDLVTASTSGQLKVVDTHTKAELFSKQLSGLKGVQLDQQGAVLKAIEKTSGTLKQRTVPQFHRSYLK